MSNRNRRSFLDELVAQLPPPTEDHIQLTRRNISQSEIESAVRLFIKYEDFSSAHLLACAAIEILHQLSASSNEKTSKQALDKSLKEILGDQEAAKMREFLDLPFNFFKHSSSDQNQTIHIRPEFTEIIIYSAAIDFRITFGELTPIMAAYTSWFMSRHPSSFPSLPSPVKKLINDMALSDIPLKKALVEGRKLMFQVLH